MKYIWIFVLLIISGCDNIDRQRVGSFSTGDVANKAIVLLENKGIESKIVFEKEMYHIEVNTEHEMNARRLLSEFNFYYKSLDLNDLLESKFSSLSKLETIKSNLLSSRELSNKLNVIPGILKVEVVTSGDEEKQYSVIILSLEPITESRKREIKQFLTGVIKPSDKLTVSYLVNEV
ncbi:type III secretion protein [Vibrio aquaticus]|uniref:Type III secretion protein n=1 Tax=Vibrio aquaticus TaxID=2496559 RepID=A0A432CZR6_9VIBR|nr:type III secretion protein [Vibrio aquaticus]RTZ16644.1 type III secretion protein [Vibrio aquaticus]